MAMDFPGQPTVGQVYTVGSISYVWNGYAWAGGGSAPLPATTIVSDTPPVNPRPGETWWESDTGILFMNYDDGNGPAQWVQINATIPAVPADGGEYVWVNNIWRLKEQGFVLDGKTAQDIIVPATAKMLTLTGSLMIPSAALQTPILRVSFDGTTFMAGASDYQWAPWPQHLTGTAAYAAQATTPSAHLPLTPPHDHATLPATFTADMNVAKAGSYFWMKAYSKGYYSATTNLFETFWQSGYVNNAAATAATQIKAIRLLMGSVGAAFGASSYVSARWSY